MRDEWVLKICVAGSSQETKPLIRHHAEDKFQKAYTPTIGVDVAVKRITVDNQQIKILFWDVASQSVFGRIRPMYFERAFACIFPYAKNNRKSFGNIQKLFREFAINERKDAPCAVIGIISEPERVTRKAGKQLAKKMKIQYYEMAIEDREAFTTIITNMVKIYLEIITGEDEKIRFKIVDLAKLRFISIKLATMLVDKGVMKDIFIKWTRQDYNQFKDKIPGNYRSTLGRAYNFHHKCQ